MVNPEINPERDVKVGEEEPLDVKTCPVVPVRLVTPPELFEIKTEPFVVPPSFESPIVGRSLATIDLKLALPVNPVGPAKNPVTTVLFCPVPPLANPTTPTIGPADTGWKVGGAEGPLEVKT